MLWASVIAPWNRWHWALAGSKIRAVNRSTESDAPLVAVVQDALTGEILWLGLVGPETPLAVIESGEISIPDLEGGMALPARHVARTPDGTGVVVLVEGPATRSQLDSILPPEPQGSAPRVGPELMEMQTFLGTPGNQNADSSRAKALLEAGVEQIGQKIEQEASSLARALSQESSSQVASKAADTIYHLLVGLLARDVPLRLVIDVLAARSGTSGLTDQSRRGSAPSA